MKSISRMTFVFAIALYLAVAFAAAQNVPNPVISLIGTTPSKFGGKEFTQYIYSVANANAYPAEMFAAAPDLPPCGKNTKSSRTWIDVFDQRGNRLYGFCAFTKPADLEKIWFTLESGVTPPSYIYIQLHDRKTDTKYKSNLADTVP